MIVSKSCFVILPSPPLPITGRSRGRGLFVFSYLITTFLPFTMKIPFWAFCTRWPARL